MSSETLSLELDTKVRELLRRLVACDTSNPPGRETQAVAILEDYLTEVGLEFERVVSVPEVAGQLGPFLAGVGVAGRR